MNTKNAIGFTGVGVFLYLILATVEFTFSRILHESLIWFEGNALFTHALTVYIPMALVIGLFVYALKWIRIKWDKGNGLKGIFKAVVVIYIIVVIVQFGLTMLEGLYHDHAYFDFLETYRATLNEQYLLRQFLIDTPAWIIKYIIIGSLIYKEIKTLPNNYERT